MSWSLDIERASLDEAEAALARSEAPESIKAYVETGIARLRKICGDDVGVTVRGHGHVCEDPAASRITSATIDVRRAE